MDKQKEIEEMAKITDTAKKPCDCLCVSECIKHHPNCTFRNRNEWSCIGNVRAESIYSAGYRKASDVIDDFVERVKERLEEFTKQDYEDGVPYYHADCEQIDNVIDDVADEMRQEVEK